MKNYKIIALALSLLALASCGQKASIKGKVAGASDSQIIIKELNVNTYNVLDTIKTSADGSFSYSLDVAEGQPEFVYIFYKDTRIAGLLLETGETAKVEADTLGNYSVSGSKGSEDLHAVESAYTDFIKQVIAADEDSKAVTEAYIKHYRECVKYVMNNPKSMACIPVLYEQLNGMPIFTQYTDALHFRSVCDSLKTIYPESRYVKALDKEAARREQMLMVSSSIKNAELAGFPNLTLPNEKGEKVDLNSIDAKCIMIHFWDSSDASHSMFNNEVLLPIYNEFHSKGFEIYSVCLDIDKSQWASVVKSQKLPWINVNDGLGAYSPAVSLYGVASVPTAFLIADGDLVLEPIEGSEGLRKELAKRLR